MLYFWLYFFILGVGDRHGLKKSMVETYLRDAFNTGMVDLMDETVSFLFLILDVFFLPYSLLIFFMLRLKEAEEVSCFFNSDDYYYYL